MFRELVELGQKLEQDGKLTVPEGFYSYREPIRWIVHILPGKPLKVWLEETELYVPRPFDGRTSAIRAHPLTDEAGYALGVAQKKGGDDKRAEEKYTLFKELLNKLINSPVVTRPALREAVRLVVEALESDLIKSDPRFNRIETKDWVSFVVEEGELARSHLFQHPEVKRFWVEEVKERSAQQDKNGNNVRGECAICGSVDVLLKKIPLQVKLFTTAPLHSYNKDAFVSFWSGQDVFEKTHIGICFSCADTASRAFNYLSNSRQHCKVIVRDKTKNDSLANQIAVYWLKAPAPLRLGKEELKIDDLLVGIGALLSEEISVKQENAEKEPAPPADPVQLTHLLHLPWQPVDARLQLDAYAFYLGVLSPNVGRVVLREWFGVTLTSLKENLTAYLRALKLSSPWGDSAPPVSVAAMVEALNSSDPNLVRGLLRCAYLGYHPSTELLSRTVQRLRIIWLKLRRDKSNEERMLLQQISALTALLKLIIFYGKEEAEEMEELNLQYVSPPYLCGRLLAILEEAQLRAADFKLSTTMVNRFYGSASMAPASVFGNLLRLSTVAHLPERGKELNELVEEILSRLAEKGGFPRILNLQQQAEFALGFYHQRAYFRARRGKQDTAGGNSRTDVRPKV